MMQAKQYMLGLLAVSGLATAASAQTAIFSATGRATDTVIPGTGGLTLNSGLSGGLTFSPDGNYWLFQGFLDTSGDQNEVLFLGQGLSATSIEFIGQENQTALFGNGLNIDDFDQRNGVTNNGDLAISGAFDTGSTADDDFVGSRINGVWTLLAQEGGDASALFGAGAVYDELLSGRIDSNNRVSFLARSIDGVADTADQAVIRDGVVFIREGDSVGGPGEAWQTLDSDGFYTDPTGDNWLLRGDTDLTDVGVDDVLVYNGTVVLRQGDLLAGDSLNIIRSHFLSSSGNWWAAVELSNDEDVLIRNGVIIAATGSAAVGTLNWSEVDDDQGVPLFAENSLGQYVFGGDTDGDAASDQILLFMDGTIVLREGDAVDLDGNGLFDDGVFISDIEENDLFLRDDLTLLAYVALRDASGSAAGRALIYKAVPAPGGVALIAAGGLLAARRRR